MTVQCPRPGLELTTEMSTGVYEALWVDDIRRRLVASYVSSVGNNYTDVTLENETLTKRS